MPTNRIDLRSYHTESCSHAHDFAQFKQVIGCGIAEYWRMKKLHHAKRLLSQRNFSIEAIAFEVGYENLPAFSRRFSSVFGVSPSQWRAKTLTAKKMRQKDN